MLGIQDVNLKDNKKSYDSNEDEWRIFTEDQLRLAIGDASLDILNYTLKRQEISQMLHQEKFLFNTTELLTMTYNRTCLDMAQRKPLRSISLGTIPCNYCHKLEHHKKSR